VLHPAEGQESGTWVERLIAPLRASFPGIGRGVRRPRLCARLDKDTTGDGGRERNDRGIE